MIVVWLLDSAGTLGDLGAAVYHTPEMVGSLAARRRDSRAAHPARRIRQHLSRHPPPLHTWKGSGERSRGDSYMSKPSRRHLSIPISR